MALGKFVEALYDITLAIRIEKDGKNDNKSMGDYFKFAGQCHFELGQYSEALDHFTKAKDKHVNGHNWFNMGLAKSKLLLFSEANKDLLQAHAKFKLGKDNTS